MTWQQIILIILGSSVISVMVSNLFNWWQKKKEAEKERYQKLYGPLKFYLRVIKITKPPFAGLFLEELQDYISKRKEEIVLLDQDNYYDRWLNLLEKITKVIEDNPGLIKKDHIFSFSVFLDHYIKQEMKDKKWWIDLMMLLSRLKSEVDD